MGARIQFLPLLSIFFLISSSFIPQSYSQLTSQNIQVFYPFPLPPPPPPPPPIPPPETSPTDTPTTSTPTLTTPTTTSTGTSKSSNKTVATAVAATAASTLVLSGLFFLLLVKYKRYRKVKEKEKETPGVYGGNDNSNTQNPAVSLMNHFTRFEGVKGVIVDEEGLDVLYWKNLEDDEPKKTIFKKEIPIINDKEEEKKIMTVDHGRRKSNIQIQEVPLLRGKSSASHIWPSEDDIKIQNSLPVANQEILKSQLSSRSPPPTPPTPPPPPPPPPAPVVVVRKSHVPPPPLLLPKTGGLTLTSSSTAPPPPSQVKLKPLHWDKVNANVGHPTAWDKLNNGSFR